MDNNRVAASSSPEGDAGPQFPIGTVARRTGLSPHVLRAWERRYGVVEPVRSEGGTRLYSNADVFRLRLLRHAVEAGHSISRVAGLSGEELLKLVGQEAAGELAGDRVGGAGTPERYMVECLEAVESMDGERVHALLMRAAITLSATDFTERLVVPLLERVGELWESGELCPAHEHVLSSSVQRVLGWILASVTAPGDAPVVVVTTLEGHRHELAALMAATEAVKEGWRVTYLGPDLPASDIATAVEATGASALILSVIRESTEDELREQLGRLRSRIGSIPVLIGGRGAAAHEVLIGRAGGTWIPNFATFRVVLGALAARNGDYGGRDGSDTQEEREDE
jgi:MerR family transcriptional regulator, light-induced transcriptional regulator